MRRDTVFISKATPGDDEFVLWLAPRLEANGYTVFADILSLEAGDRWRKIVTGTLQKKSIKMLLCCRDSTLERDGVQEEIGIAEEIAKELGDPRFIIPLRLEKFKKLFGIGELQRVNFVGSWASGLKDLLKSLKNQNVPRSTDKIRINPNWENYKRRLAIKINNNPENLTSSWLRISSVPEYIRFYQFPSGGVDHSVMQRICMGSPFPCETHWRGFFSFAMPDEVDRNFAVYGKFPLASEHNLRDFINKGSESPNIPFRAAQNLVLSMFRKSWENYCRKKGLYEYLYSKQPGFHITHDQVSLGKRIPWGNPEQRRSAMLLNAASGKIWQYGVSASPYFWPFPHFRVKSRVLFSTLAGKESGEIINDINQQHRYRRSICKGWRNKAWHGRFMAFGSCYPIHLQLLNWHFLNTLPSKSMQNQLM